jgi:hypothetical protein
MELNMGLDISAIQQRKKEKIQKVCHHHSQGKILSTLALDTAVCNVDVGFMSLIRVHLIQM